MPNALLILTDKPREAETGGGVEGGGMYPPASWIEDI